MTQTLDEYFEEEETKRTAPDLQLKVLLNVDADLLSDKAKQPNNTSLFGSELLTRWIIIVVSIFKMFNFVESLDCLFYS